MLRRTTTGTSGGVITPLDKPISKETPVVNECAFALLFCEMVRYAQGKSANVAEFEEHLQGFGVDAGKRCVELFMYRDRPEKREIKVVLVLQFITSVAWTSLFGHVADGLQKSNEPDTFFILEKDPLPCRYASVPKDLGNLNLAAFNAGLIRGMLDAQGFPCNVTAHVGDVKGGQGTIYVCKFPKEVMDRQTER